MNLLTQRSRESLESLNIILVATIRKNLVRKGHRVTSKLFNSIESRVKSNGVGVLIEILGEAYGEWQERGQHPGGKLRNIAALTKWVQQRGIAIEFKEAKGIAFAIAKTHQKIGMHTRGGRIDLSKRGFISESITELDRTIDNILFRAFDQNFETLVTDFTRQTEEIIKLNV